MSHPRELLTIWRDPGIARGPFRVLPRTDGRWIVVDDRRELGRMTVSDHETVSAAAEWLRNVPK